MWNRAMCNLEPAIDESDKVFDLYNFDFHSCNITFKNVKAAGGKLCKMLK